MFFNKLGDNKFMIVGLHVFENENLFTLNAVLRDSF